MKRINWKKLLPESDALIIQLGSYNGVECEEYGLNTVLKEQNHQAILVEPQSNVFAELVQNYKHASSRLWFENLAIVHDRGTGSARLFLKGPESSLVRHTERPSEDVWLEDFAYLKNKYRINRVHGLFMDIEGLEYDVIKDILTHTDVVIEFIRFEYILVHNYQRIDKLLEENGYTVCKDWSHAGDKVAIRNDIFDFEHSTGIVTRKDLPC